MGKRAIVLLIALLLGGAAGFSVLQYLRSQEAAITERRQDVKVFRATQAIPEGQEGQIILDNSLYIESVEQQEDLPADAITRAEDLQAVLRGKVAVGPVGSNEILTSNQWVALSTQITPLRELIPDGLQAVTLSPGEVQGVNGFAEPGDRVNVVVTIDLEATLTEQQNAPDFGIPTETEEGSEESTVTEVIPYTRFVLQNIEVLAAGRDVVSRDTTPEVSVEGETGPEAGNLGGEVQDDTSLEEVVTIYTLAVDPDQTEKLVYAIENGSIYLTLVKSDYEPVATQGVTVQDLFGTDLTSDIFGN